MYTNPYDTNNEWTSGPEIQPTPKKDNALTKKAALSIMCATLIASSALGFGGGYLAANLSEPDSTPTSNIVSSSVPQASSSASVSPTVSTTSNQGMSVSEVVSATSDSVVEITTEITKSSQWMQQYSTSGAGSGVIVSEDGYIVTNNHVVEDANSIKVRLKNGDSYDAVMIGTDSRTDLAVIKIEAPGLKAAVMGSSSDLQVGDDAIAIGNPLGELGGTVTNGIISALDRELTLDGETHNLLQTNAAINPGNSGGGLFNNKGELIGIVVAKSSGSGIEGLGFAIPIDDAKPVVEDLISKGYVTGRGRLGIESLEINDPRTAFMYRVSQSGVYVATVEAGSTGEEMGLKAGDRIVTFNGTEITSYQDLKNALEKCTAGETVTITVDRDGETLTLSAPLHEYIPESAQTVQA